MRRVLRKFGRNRGFHYVMAQKNKDSEDPHKQQYLLALPASVADVKEASALEVLPWTGTLMAGRLAALAVAHSDVRANLLLTVTVT